MFKFIFNKKLLKLSFIYDLLGHLKGMFWVSVILMFFAAAWEGIILASAATLFQSLIDTTRYSTSVFEEGSFMNIVYGYFIILLVLHGYSPAYSLFS